MITLKKYLFTFLLKIIAIFLLVIIIKPVFTQTLPNGKSYIINNDSSKVQWFCGKHNGSVLISNGYFSVSDGKINGGKFDIDMTTIINLDIDYDLMRGTLENILKSKDFFNAQAFPVSNFIITKVNHIDEKEFCITGNLKIKDISKKVHFHSIIDVKNDSIIATSKKFSIDRTKWGITTMSENHVKSDKSFIIPDEIQFVIKLYMRSSK